MFFADRQIHRFGLYADDIACSQHVTFAARLGFRKGDKVCHKCLVLKCSLGWAKRVGTGKSTHTEERLDKRHAPVVMTRACTNATSGPLAWPSNGLKSRR